MFRRYMLMVLAASFLHIAGCSASKDASTRVPGLSHNDLQALNGVWEQTNMRETQGKNEQWKSARKFGWGQGRVTPFSLLIDLTAEKPEIQLIGILWVDVDSASIPEAHHYVFKTKNKFSTNPEHKDEPTIDRIDIILNADGTIYFIESIGETAQITLDEKNHFFRTYGPGVSQ